MRFLRSWQERFGNRSEEVQCSLCNWFCERLDFLFELLEFMVQDRLEDSSDLSISRECEINQVELALCTLRDLCTTTTWRTHCSNELDVNELLENITLSSIEPTFVIHPLSKQFERRLTAKLIFSRHVQIIDEDDHFLAVRNHFIFGTTH